MSRSPRRLARLLDLRRRQEEAARVQLAQSLRRAATISDEVRTRSEALEDVLAGERPVRERSNLEMLTEIATPAILAAKAAEASAMGAVQEIRREWNRTAVRLKGIERADERQRDAAREAEAAVALRALDDAMTSRVGREDEA